VRKFFVLVFIVLSAEPAVATTSFGSGALALAALVGIQSPSVSYSNKHELTHLLNGNTTGRYPPRRTIAVRADSVVCRSSDVAIAQHGCTLTFGTRKVSLSGRAAHELYATLLEVGVHAGVAAGSVYADLKDLACTVDPHVVAQAAGGGASCTFTPGP
jgi:hypothetical protein